MINKDAKKYITDTDIEIAKAMHDISVELNTTDILSERYAVLQSRLTVYQEYWIKRHPPVDKSGIIEKVCVEAVKIAGIIVAIVVVSYVQNGDGFIRNKEVFPLINKMV